MCLDKAVVAQGGGGGTKKSAGTTPLLQRAPPQCQDSTTPTPLQPNANIPNSHTTLPLFQARVSPCAHQARTVPAPRTNTTANGLPLEAFKMGSLGGLSSMLDLSRAILSERRGPRGLLFIFEGLLSILDGFPAATWCGGC